MGRGWKRIAPDADAAPVPYPTKPHQGIARHGDRPNQLQPLLGQSVSRAADRRGLCTDAGTAPERCGHQLCKCASLDTAGALPETGGAGDGFDTAHGCASAAIVPVPGDLPAYGDDSGGFARLERYYSNARQPDWSDQTDSKGKPCPETPAATPANANQVRRCPRREKSRSHRHVRQAHAAQKTVLYAFMNNAG